MPRTIECVPERYITSPTFHSNIDAATPGDLTYTRGNVCLTRVDGFNRPEDPPKCQPIPVDIYPDYPSAKMGPEDGCA